MLFTQWAWAGIADGSITVTFRRWAKPQAAVGRPNRTPAGRVMITAIDIVDPLQIIDADARRAGFASADEACDALSARPDLPVYRVEFRFLDEPDPRSELAAAGDLSDADVTSLTTRLGRLDAGSPTGPWTRQALSLIASYPARRAPDLAKMTGMERDPFKLNIRKLKALGLTESLKVGYQLSSRGQAYLDATNS